MRFSLLFACAAFAACSRTPEHRLDFPGDDPRDLGSVRITERAITRIQVENSGRQAITLDSVALGDGWRGVVTIDPDSTGCVPGLSLAVGEHCLVAVAFEPANDIPYPDSLLVDYRPREGEAGPLRATLSLRGTGVLDCSVTPELTRSYEEGIADADAQIAVDVAEATAAGEALTRDDGYTDGYGSAYDAAFAAAYESGYDDGIAEGYDDGYAEGASPAACLEGENDGYADGVDAGITDGETDGAIDGDAVGYDDGYFNGSCDGELDSCGFVSKVDPDPSLPGKCVDRGYADTYSRSHYDEAYAVAVAANVAYQEGLAMGTSEGNAAGQTDGDAEGYADGYRDGADQGFADGDADQYEACYLVAFDEGYEDGYVDGYDAIYGFAYDAAYANGYDNGYAAGLVCG